MSPWAFSLPKRLKTRTLGAPGPSPLGTGEGGETDWQLGIHSTTATYDAVGRMVEKGLGGVYTQFSYRPDGVLLALYSGGPKKTTIPLPGGSTAIYNASGLSYIRHTDWLGSSRLAPVSRESYEVEGAPGPSLLGTGEGGEADWQLGLHSGNCQPLRWMIIDRQGTTK